MAEEWSTRRCKDREVCPQHHHWLIFPGYHLNKSMMRISTQLMENPRDGCLRVQILCITDQVLYL
ncbi:hypothetical protein MUK42_33773 [Musa troglodytarum]|uniref:Uncharacterized protein n=1 Tax=Musa troglodytarum TaxID=320322 RepID=A0A9E7FPF6_9LILI|nr:hypothetical protein MUK42_33773 [Musa troglodytarum]